MSLTAVRSHFREKLNSLKLREWTDGFDVENIPSTLFDRAYHIGAPSGNNVLLNQGALTITGTFEVKLFLKGFRNNALAIDQAIEAAENAIKECSLAATNAKGNLKKITPGQLTIEPYAATNDNAVIVNITFEAMVVLQI